MTPLERARLEAGDGSLELWQGDITLLGPEVEAIVTAANEWLRGGGGVDGAIHRAAGPMLLQECSRLGVCPTGEARITGAGWLPQKHVIHAVGPVYDAYDRAESARLLRGAYQCSLDLARERGLASVAFPAISTGVYGYPLEEAAAVALETLLEHLRAGQPPRRLLLVLYGQDALGAHQRALARLTSPGGAA